jgi:hypothetical protein
MVGGWTQGVHSKLAFLLSVATARRDAAASLGRTVPLSRAAHSLACLRAMHLDRRGRGIYRNSFVMVACAGRAAVPRAPSSPAGGYADALLQLDARVRDVCDHLCVCLAEQRANNQLKRRMNGCGYGSPETSVRMDSDEESKDH